MASTLIAGTIIKEKGIFPPIYLARQARELVNLASALRACEAVGLVNTSTIWFEVGPEPVNLGLICNTLNASPKSLLPTFKLSEDNWETICYAVSAAYTSAITIEWTQYYERILACLEPPGASFLRL